MGAACRLVMMPLAVGLAGWPRVSHAADPKARAAALPEARGDRDGLLVVVEDRSAPLAGATWTVEADDARLEMPLRDDGAAPDAAADDGVWTGLLAPAPQARSATLTLADGSGAVRWRDRAPLAGPRPVVRVSLDDGGAAVVLEAEPPPSAGPVAAESVPAPGRDDRLLPLVVGLLGLGTGTWLGLTLAPLRSSGVAASEGPA